MESDHLPSYFGIAVGAAIALLAVDLNLAVQTSHRWRFWIFYFLLVAASAIAYWLWLEIRRDEPLLKVDDALVEDVWFWGLSESASGSHILGTAVAASGTSPRAVVSTHEDHFQPSQLIRGQIVQSRPSAYLFVRNAPRRKRSTRDARSVHLKLEFWDEKNLLIKTLGRWSDLDQGDAPETFGRARERDIAPNSNPYKIDVAAQLDMDCCYVMNDQARNGGWRVYPFRAERVRVKVIVEGSGGIKTVSNWLLERLSPVGIKLTPWVDS